MLPVTTGPVMLGGATAPGPMITRITALSESATKTLSCESMHIPLGWFIWALTAGPPSPEKPVVPLPAYTLITPAVVTLITREYVLSRMYQFPELSEWNATGLPILPPVAVRPTGPPPITVVIFCA